MWLQVVLSLGIVLAQAINLGTQHIEVRCGYTTSATATFTQPQQAAYDLDHLPWSL